MVDASLLAAEYDVVSRVGELQLQYTSHIAEALRSLMTGSPFSADVVISSRDTDKLIAAGLGPVFFHVLKDHPDLLAIDNEMKFKASDITSRMLSGEQFKNLEFVIGLLQTVHVVPVILKGAAYATDYYPEPHQRIMGDIDLLLPADRIEDAEAALISDGFEKAEPAPGMNYDTHIHSPPLFHSGRNMWIELHRRLIKTVFPPGTETPLNLSTSQHEVRSTRVGNLEARRFRSEFELIYLASYWCYDLTRSFAKAGVQRGLFDATLLLKSKQDQLDWDTILRWSENTLSGACLYILLSFLNRIGVFDDETNVCGRLGRQQCYVNATTLNLMHKRMNKYLLELSNFGRVSSSSTTSNLFASLIRKKPAWKNLIAGPVNIVFPEREARRFEFGYQANRIRGALSRHR